MTTLHFITGWFSADPATAAAAHASLCATIQQKYAQAIPGLSIIFHRYTDDVAAALLATTGPIVLRGLSFGGWTAIDAAAKLAAAGRALDKLILDDPVRWSAPNIGPAGPDAIDFTLAAGVGECVCFWRGPTNSGPWSAPIRLTAGDVGGVLNVLQPGTFHGDSLWNVDGYGAMNSAVNGQAMIQPWRVSNPAVAAVTVAPPVIPVPPVVTAPAPLDVLIGGVKYLPAAGK